MSGQYLDGVSSPDGQNDALGLVVTDYDKAGLQHPGKPLLHEYILGSDAQLGKHQPLSHHVPLPQGLTKLHEVSHAPKLPLQSQIFLSGLERRNSYQVISLMVLPSRWRPKYSGERGIPNIQGTHADINEIE